MSTILIVILVLLLIGAVPTWPHSRGWGYYPSGLLGLVLLILLIVRRYERGARGTPSAH